MTVICFLSLILILSTMSTTIKASAVTLSIPDMRVSPGSSVEIPVNVYNPEGLAANEFCATYDCSVLECNGATKGNLIQEWTMYSGRGRGGNCQICALGYSQSLAPLPPVDGNLVKFQCKVGNKWGKKDVCLKRVTLADGNTNEMPLTESGCAVLTVAGSIDDIQNFYKNSVDSGNLVGVGSTLTSAAHRLKALGNMLAVAKNLIEREKVTKACEQLEDALEKTDGVTRPGDLVAGPAAADLASMIKALMDTLECK